MTEQNVKPNQHKKTLVLLIILIILIIATALGRYFWLRFGTTITTLQNNLSQKQALIQNLQNQNEAQKQDYVKATSWKPIAIEHLVRMADLALNTNGDVKTALAFLMAAKKYTGNIEDSAIDHALNKDIASLQAVLIVDPEELVLTIDMISQQIDTLSIIPSQAATAPTAPWPTESQPAQLLQRLFTNVVKALKGIVIIRHQATEPILPPEQVTILRFNIQAKLLQAQLAVIQRQNKLYQACLAQTIDLITKHFVDNNTATTNVLQILQKLQQTNLQPDLPTLTATTLKS